MHARILIYITLLTSLSHPLGAEAADAASTGAARSDSAFDLPASYSARVDRAARHWQLLDPHGSALALEVQDCGPRGELPPGLWLLSSDSSGRPRLLAPSATPLPPGHSGVIEVATCGQPRPGATLQLPTALLSALKEHASALYVHD
jgi:hypothetical protein